MAGKAGPPPLAGHPCRWRGIPPMIEIKWLRTRSGDGAVTERRRCGDGAATKRRGSGGGAVTER
eukprot:7340878-Lingulodinium_polyedra.AAC.1